MNRTETSLRSTPYGLAFTLADLVVARKWAEQRNLHMNVVLDAIIDGSEFEEMLVIAPEGSARRTLTIWRTADTVYAQLRPARRMALPRSISYWANCGPRSRAVRRC